MHNLILFLTFFFQPLLIRNKISAIHFIYTYTYILQNIQYKVWAELGREQLLPYTVIILDLFSILHIDIGKSIQVALLNCEEASKVVIIQKRTY